METLSAYLDKAQQMQRDAQLDKKAYAEIEKYIIANELRQRGNPAFLKLKDTMDALANQFSLPTISSQQENFGLNSCAQ